MQPVDLRVVPWHFVLVQTEYLLSCGCERLMLWQKHWERWPRARGWLQGRCHSALSHLLSDLETVPTVSHHVGLFPGDRSWQAFGKRFGGHVKKSLIKSPSILFSVQMLPLWKKGPSPSSWVCLGQYILSAVCISCPNNFRTQHLIIALLILESSRFSTEERWCGSLLINTCSQMGWLRLVSRVMEQEMDDNDAAHAGSWDGTHP